jgi:glycosyltransferase involved in cell wall biosynthesis
MNERIGTPRLTIHNEVETAPIATLADYRSVTSSEDFSRLMTFAKRLTGKKLVFFNSTIQGGGVALMRHALIRLFRLLAVDAHWYVMLPRPAAFVVTKEKFHNILQAVAGPQVLLTEKDQRIYRSWILQNVQRFAPVFQQANVIVIDDPQPSGLIPFIKKANPQVKIIYRSHIHIVSSLVNQPGTPQQKTWEFLWKRIQEADCFVSHPVKAFVPQNVPAEKVVLMPATTDPFDGLNRPLAEETMTHNLHLFNQCLFDEKQLPLDLYRPYIAQIARFDPAKGFPDVIEAYRLLREMLQDGNMIYPQLVLAGNAAVDDPDAPTVYRSIMGILQSKKYAHLAHDVKVGRLPHRDELLNTLLRKCSVALQLSIREGFEVKVTEALMKGKPVVAYRTGGIPLQIEDGLDGFLVDVGDHLHVVHHLYRLLTDADLSQRMSRAAACLYNNQEYLTVSNAICWLFLALWLLEKGRIEGYYRSVKTLASQAASLERLQDEHEKEATS